MLEFWCTLRAELISHSQHIFNINLSKFLLKRFYFICIFLLVSFLDTRGHRIIQFAQQKKRKFEMYFFPLLSHFIYCYYHGNYPLWLFIFERWTVAWCHWFILYIYENCIESKYFICIVFIQILVCLMNIKIYWRV